MAQERRQTWTDAITYPSPVIPETRASQKMDALNMRKEEKYVEEKNYTTCRHIKRIGNYAVFVESTCKQATMIRGQLVVSKNRCQKCDQKPEKCDQKPENSEVDI